MFASAKLTSPVVLYAALLAVTLPALGRSGAVPATPSAAPSTSVYLTVEEGSKLVKGLNAANFRMSVDGQGVPFKLESPQTPVSIALLTEFSGSSADYYGDIATAVESFLEEAPPDNWYALATFSRDLHVEVDFTKKIGVIQDAFSSLGEPSWDEVDTYDAVYRMLDIMGRLPGRRVLVFVGSGFNSFSSHSFDDVLEKAESVNVTIYCAAAGSEFRGEYSPYMDPMADLNLAQTREFLTALGEKSGGQTWFPDMESAYHDVMKGIVQSLQNQYRLVTHYRPPRDSKLHKLDVEAFLIKDDHRKDYSVRVREGWRLEP